jgi:hypothetical protein
MTAERSEMRSMNSSKFDLDGPPPLRYSKRKPTAHKHHWVWVSYACDLSGKEVYRCSICNKEKTI